MATNLVRHVALSLASFTLLLPVVVQAEEGELWQTEVKVEMPGMPMAMPPQTATVCQPKGRGEEMSIPKDASCKITDLKKNGNTTRFKITCNGQGNAMTGSGEVETLGSDRYRGTMQMAMNHGGEKMVMNQNFSSKRIGKCDYPSR